MNVLRSALATGMVLALGAGAAGARELSVDPAEMVPVELATIGISPLVGAPVVLLRDTESGDIVPIFIGENEARAILMAMREVPVPRPMTHDLMASLLSALDARLNRVLVDDLVDGTYLGMLELEVGESGQTLLVDSRPSDAMALAVRTGAPILVARSVIAAASGMEYEGLASDQVVSALGITVVEATPDYRETLGLPDEQGLLVWRSTGVAADAGLAAGSLILTVNGQVPAVPMDFLELIRDTPVGEDVQIRYWLDGERHELTLPRDLVPQTGREPPRVEV
jgi:uncharacterized protein